MVELSEGHFHQGTHMAFCVKRNVFLIGLIDALINNEEPFEDNEV